MGRIDSLIRMDPLVRIDSFIRMYFVRSNRSIGFIVRFFRSIVSDLRSSIRGCISASWKHLCKLDGRYLSTCLVCLFPFPPPYNSQLCHALQHAIAVFFPVVCVAPIDSTITGTSRFLLFLPILLFVFFSSPSPTCSFCSFLPLLPSSCSSFHFSSPFQPPPPPPTRPAFLFFCCSFISFFLE